MILSLKGYKMDYKRVLTVQDISCVGQCSLTVALPIISACGIEACPLPSAVLSTHTGGFKGFTFRDLTDDMPAIRAHWIKEGLYFDAIYTGYLGSVKQIGIVEDILAENGKEGALKIVDPAMADHGKLYTGFDMEFVQAMKGLCGKADYLLPNITEACFLTDTEYREDYDREYVEALLRKLAALGCKSVIFTGICFNEGKTGVIVYKDGVTDYYEHDLLPNSCHGTGDIYASAFTGALVRGKAPYEAAKIAADFTVKCIESTASLPDHWYGARFETSLGYLIDALN